MTVVLVHGNPETDAVWGPLVAEFDRSGVLQSDDVVRLSPPDFGAPMPQGWGATVEEYRLWLVEELEALGEPVDLVGHDWGGGHVVNVAMTRPDLPPSPLMAPGSGEPDLRWHGMPGSGRRPGLALHRSPTTTSSAYGRHAPAGRGRGSEVLDGLGHWWMLQDPARGVAVLTEFWASLRATVTDPDPGRSPHRARSGTRSATVVDSLASDVIMQSPLRRSLGQPDFSRARGVHHAAAHRGVKRAAWP